MFGAEHDRFVHAGGWAFRARQLAGRRRGSSAPGAVRHGGRQRTERALLAALLHVTFDEVLGVALEDLVDFVAARIAGYKKPRSIDFVDDLPRDAAGKLLKRKIREPYWSASGRRI